MPAGAFLLLLVSLRNGRMGMPGHAYPGPKKARPDYIAPNSLVYFNKVTVWLVVNRSPNTRIRYKPLGR